MCRTESLPPLALAEPGRLCLAELGRLVIGKCLAELGLLGAELAPASRAELGRLGKGLDSARGLGALAEMEQLASRLVSAIGLAELGRLRQATCLAELGRLGIGPFPNMPELCWLGS